MDKKSILVFGVGELQRSIIRRAKLKGLFIIGIDPCADAVCKDEVDAFEIVGGQDFEGTCAVVEKYGVDAIVTAATDKPLVMMARVAEKYGFPFYSVETAQWSTDKYQMKQRFLEGGVPCARGRLIAKVEEADDLYYPLIVKPRDNSGSRGVKLCRNKEELQEAMQEALQYSHLDTVLVEEYIEGQEYSIEGLHYEGRSEVIQFTEKTTTEFPYNVELAHKQPANLTEEQKNDIRELVSKIAKCMHFENCPSHTELKINERGIFIIETSPRLGGDYITSTLVPLSTGINMEDQLLNIALGEKVDTQTGRVDKASGVIFFCLPEGILANIDNRLLKLCNYLGVVSLNLKLNKGDHIKKITSSLNRYGEIIVVSGDREELGRLLEYCIDEFEKSIIIKNRFDELYIGQSYQLSHRFTKEEVKCFAELSMDCNPLHLDYEFGKTSIFGENIVHGYLSSSLISAIIGTKMPGMGSIYLKQDLSFKKPVFHGDLVTAKVTITGKKEDKSILYLDTNCYNQKGNIVIEGTAIVKLNN